MADISGSEKLNTFQPGLSLADAAFVSQLSFFGGPSLDMRVTFFCQPLDDSPIWPDLDWAFSEVVVEFRSVSDLHLDFPGTATLQGIPQIFHLDISDAAEIGPDHTFDVKSRTGKNFSFSCKTITITSVDEPKRYFGNGAIPLADA